MNKNSRLGLWAGAAGIILAAAARTVQIFCGTDMNTGFLKDDNGIFVDICFWLAVAVTIAAAVGAAVFDRKKGSAFFENPVSAVKDGRAAVIGFALLMLPALTALYEGYDRAVIPADSIAKPPVFMTAVDFICGGLLLVIAFAILYLKEFKPFLGFSLVTGAAYYTLKGIGIFMEKMAITTVPEYLINCVSCILTAVFFMQLARLLSGNEGRRTRDALLVSGAAAAATTLGNGIAGVIALFFAPAEISDRIVLNTNEAALLYQQLKGRNAYFMSLASLTDIAAGLFIAAALVVLFMKAKPEAEQTGEAADAEPDVQAEQTEQTELSAEEAPEEDISEEEAPESPEE